jgi:predicted nucleic acid-binding protein
VTAGSPSGASESSADQVVLADTSVWELAQKGNREAEATLGELADASRLATCSIVAGEIMFGTPAPARNVEASRSQLAELTFLSMSPESEARALEVMVELAKRGKHRSCGIRDLLIAAIAELHGAEIVQYDRDFDLISEVTGQTVRWVVPRGTGHRSPGSGPDPS